MSKVLIIDDRLIINQLYATNLRYYVGIDPVSIFKAKEAINLIQQDKEKEIKIIIARTAINQDPIARNIYEYLKSNDDDEVSLIVLGQNEYLSGVGISCLGEDAEVKDVVQAVACRLNITPQTMLEKSVDEFVPIPTSLLLPSLKLPCSIFKQLSEGFYKTILSEGKIICTEVLDLLHFSEIKTIYVPAKDRLRILNTITIIATEELLKNNLNPTETRALQNQSLQLVSTICREMGIDDTSMFLADKSIETMKNTLSEYKDLNKIIQSLLRDETTYNFKHTMLIMYIGTYIIQKMEWGNKEQQEKLAFIAFFHDIALTDDVLIEIESDEQLNEMNVSQKTKETVRDHALLSAKLVSKYSKIPIGVETIIKQHHGSKIGVGLSKVNQNLSPLAMVFMISEKWAKIILAQVNFKDPINRTRILEKIELAYPAVSFRKIIATLKESSDI